MIRTFIINPRAGRGLAPADIAAMEARFRPLGPAEFIIPASREETSAATRAALMKGADQIIAVGGDGTVNAVVNGFFENGVPVKPEARLAVSCSGSGCDYYASITKAAPGTDWRELVACHGVRWVDVGRIRFANAAYGERIFINMASAGMIADVVIKRERWNGCLPDWLAYTIPSAMSLFTFRPRAMEIVVDGEARRLEALAGSVSKGS
ncbi:MAG: NAD(+)/NADH kinase, partial [Nitrospinae bacterium]|nr:NAD(+)/NADH kinase [Nitrospinota bacterium]